MEDSLKATDIEDVEEQDDSDDISTKTEEVENEDTENESDIEADPRVPLFDDPEFVDPNESKYKYGIIYLSYIPEGLNVKILREIMSQYGLVGRIYLEPERNNKKHRTYVEGWIEFKKKRTAKAVAKDLNGTPLQYGRKHCKMNGQIWSIKYLHRFKWAHLTEQLTHDRAVRDQKRRFEMSQTKKQVDFYQKMTERSKRMKRGRTGNEDGDKEADKTKSKHSKILKSRQKKPKYQGEELTVDVDVDLLGNIFKKVA